MFIDEPGLFSQCSPDDLKKRVIHLAGLPDQSQILFPKKSTFLTDSAFKPWNTSPLKGLDSFN